MSKYSRRGENSKRGIVKTPPADGRQEVRVLDGVNKSMRVKPSNLSYEPREVSSLTVPDLRGCLALSGVSEKKLRGADKDDLRRMLEDVAGSPEAVARLVARANEPADPPPKRTSRAGSGSCVAGGGRGGGGGSASGAVTASDYNLGGVSTSALREGAERMASMDPAQLKQQAAAMRAMGPAGMRATNPAMANMSDVQIWQVRQSKSKRRKCANPCSRFALAWT